jgi:hypothetical protein
MATGARRVRGRLFSRLARFWSVCFLVFGLLFLAAPEAVGRWLTSLAGLFGLRGEIAAPAGTLWWVLTLSLMSTIVVLSAYCARHPRRREPYVALMTAKLVSSAGFLWLALWSGPAWLVCAVGDGFVALSLWAARRLQGGPCLPRGYARRYAGVGPLIEEYYGKVDLAPGAAFWFRYTILDGKTREASAWAILFADGEVHAARERRPVDDLAPGNVPLLPAAGDPERFRGRLQVFHLGAAHLDDGNALGRAGEISWDLHWSDSGRRFTHVPRLLYRFGLIKTSYESTFIDLRMSGEVRFGERVFRLDGAPGMVGHIVGKKKSADSWAWVHCNHFEGAPDVVFEGLSAMVPRRGGLRGPLSSFVLFANGRTYRFNRIRKLEQARSQYGDGRWTFEAEEGGVTISGEARFSGPVALVEYTDTDDSHLWCSNSKLSDLTLTLVDPARGGEQRFEARGTAAFELVVRRPPEGPVTLR